VTPKRLASANWQGSSLAQSLVRVIHDTGYRSGVSFWEHKLEEKVVTDGSIQETDKEAIIRARHGQGVFKQRVMQIEAKCRITGVENAIHLVASHCKPWRDSSNEERLNGENGLLLTPSIDHLFDRGFIGFEDSGQLIVSPVAHVPSLRRMGVETERLVNVVLRLSQELCSTSCGALSGVVSRKVPPGRGKGIRTCMATVGLLVKF
jgi:hypothetical protein